MKHTKGKWNLFIQDGNGFGVTNGDSVIAIAGEDDLPENEANANLIAAAPDMLSVLKEAVDHSVVYDTNPALIELFTHVIKKAEGK